MDHLIKTSALSAVFYLSYKLWLERETFFKSNRYYLLAGLVTSILLPLIIIPIYKTRTVVAAEIGYYLPNSSTSQLQIVADNSWSTESILLTIYCLGLLFFSIRFLIQLLSVRKLIKSGEKSHSNKTILIKTTKEIAPFSFFNYIIYNPKLLNTQDIKQVLAHEKAHVKDWHSLDISISELTVIFFWFNPFIWLYNKAIKQNLEFLADEKSVQELSCAQTYQKTLINHTVPNFRLSLINNFHNSFLKKRIIMLNKSKSKPKHRFKLVLVLPLLAFFLYSFNTETRYIDIPFEEESKIVTSDNTLIEVIFTKSTSDTELETIKKDLASEGITMTIKKLDRNSEGHISSIDVQFNTNNGSANYSVSDSNGIENFYFKMESDGSFGVSSLKQNQFVFETVDIQGTDDPTQDIVVFRGKANQAVEMDSANVIKYRIKSTIDSTDLKWTTAKTPGTSTSYQVIRGSNPSGYAVTIDSTEAKRLMFLGTTMDAQEKVIIKNPKANYVFISKDGNVKKGNMRVFPQQSMIIIDGEKAEDVELQKLSPDQIHSVNVLKNKSAIQIYGEEAKEGVIVIKTKNGENNSKIIEVSPNNTFKYEVTGVKYTEDSKGSNLAYISKHSTKEVLESHKSSLESQGLKVKYSKIRRNKAGEITRIKISLKNNEGQESSASYKSDDGIPGISYGLNDDQLVVTSDNL